MPVFSSVDVTERIQVETHRFVSRRLLGATFPERGHLVQLVRRTIRITMCGGKFEARWQDDDFDAHQRVALAFSYLRHELKK